MRALLLHRLTAVHINSQTPTQLSAKPRALRQKTLYISVVTFSCQGLWMKPFLVSQKSGKYYRPNLSKHRCSDSTLKATVRQLNGSALLSQADKIPSLPSISIKLLSCSGTGHEDRLILNYSIPSSESSKNVV